MEHVFKHPYAVRDCPERPPITYIYRCHQPPVKSVKTRRKPLSDIELYLQMDKTGVITTEVAQPHYYRVPSAPQRKTKKKKTNLDIEKGEDGKKEIIYKVAVPPLREAAIAVFLHGKNVNLNALFALLFSGRVAIIRGGR
jgi:hypothetical protein